MNDYAKEMRDRLHAAHAEIATLKQQNAELLAALEGFLSNSSVQANSPYECEKAEQAIVKAQE